MRCAPGNQPGSVWHTLAAAAAQACSTQPASLHLLFRPPNFFLRSEEQREVLLCCRGTFSPEDAFVDLLATGVQRVCALSAGSTDCDEQLKPAPKDMISDLLATDTRIESEHWLIVGCDWS